MKTNAIRMHAIGGPDVLHYESVALGTPGPGEVLLRHHAIGLNFADIYMRTGLYPPAHLPFIPGAEAAGEVIEVGAGVTSLAPGDRVAYGTGVGAYAQERVAKVDNLVKLPKGISYETAAAMMLKGLTVHYLLRSTFRVKKGDTILLHAAAGGLGLILAQWAFALGADVIGTVSSPEKAKLARKAGCKHVIDYTKDDFAKQVKKFTKGELCDVVYDGVGKTTFMGSLDCLKPLGMMVSFGNASGPVEGVNLGILAAKGSLFVTRPTLATYTRTAKEIQGRSKDLFKMVTSGDVVIDIGARHPLADAAAAQTALEARQTTGATILMP